MMTQPAQPAGVEEPISVVTSSTSGSSQSISITPVRQQLSQNVNVVNVVELPLDSPGDGSNNEGGGAQVTAQVVVSSGPNSGDQANGNSEHATLVGSTHYITVAVSEGDAVGSDTVAQGVHSSYVQYVEGATEQAIYQAANGQMAYPVYTVGGDTGSMYTPATGQYYTPGNQTAVTYTQVTQSQAANQLQAASQLLATQGNPGAYLIQQGVDPDTAHSIIAAQRASPSAVTAEGGSVSYLVPSTTNTSSLDEDSHSNNLSHATRVSPATQATTTRVAMPDGIKSFWWDAPLEWVTEGSATDRAEISCRLKQVQWLLENYETAEGVSLPRSTLYNHYLRHCSDHKLDPVNAASFGKLIRSVFLGLRTRRLGTRGNSKYHYYGIRIKPGSSLNGMSDDGTPRHQQQGSQKRFKFLSGQKNMDQYEQANNQSNHSSSQSPQGHEYEDVNNISGGFNTQRNSQMGQHLQYLGDGSGAIPDFPEIMLDCHAVLPGECTLEDVDTLRSIYREHCEAFLDAVNNLEFVTVESLWREFWRSQDNNNGEECEEEKYLSKTKLYQLCSCKAVQDFMHSVDLLFYQNLVEVLIPDVLRPIPSSLTQAIRNFAKGLETWLTAAMTGCPPEMTQIKVSAVGALAQTLRRYTSLNHLAQAARAVLQNSAQITQMLVDLNRVDFHNVQEQASWVCECDDAVVQRLESDFKFTLQQQNSLEQWAVWLKGVVTRVLKPYEGKGKDCYTKAARQFLLKWSFYSSMVIRDLTLRSAASFGSFHLIRLLYDEYMFYLIEHEVAIQTGETPIAVMGEKYGSPPMSPSSLMVDGLGLGYLLGQPPCNGGVMHKMEPTEHSPSKRHKIS